MSDYPSDLIKSHAVELGFNLVGITRAEPSPTLQAYFRWLELGLQAEMGYMARADRQLRRRDLNVILPGVRSLIIVGLDYHALNMPTEILTDPSRGRIAAYAWGEDYHDIMMPRLEALADWLRQESKHDIACRVYVDTGAILERSHAQQAGLGFIGKNTMLINARRGSYFFLGEILTDLPVDSYDEPERETMCGSCQRCQVACPTKAFPAPYVLDSRRCISYLTIENKGWIDPALRPLMGNWIYGCDICQDICPFSRFALPAQEEKLYPVDSDRAAPPLLDILTLSDGDFSARFSGSPVARIKRVCLVRNACVAAANWGSDEAVPALIALLDDPEPLIRGHAAYALSRIQGEGSHNALSGLLDHERDPRVQDEIRSLLN